MGYSFTREIIDRDNNSIQLYDTTWAASDHVYGVLRLGCALEEIVDPQDFSLLFEEYIIRSMTFKITSFFDGALPGFEAIAATGAPAPRYSMPMVPKIEMIIVPNDTYLAQDADYATMTRVQIDERLACLQRKKISTLAYKKTFHCSRPFVRALMTMNTQPLAGGVPASTITVREVNSKAKWNPMTIPSGMKIRHYGFTILFRRVDGEPFQDPAFWTNAPPSGPGIDEAYLPVPNIKLRKHLNFSCRAVS